MSRSLCDGCLVDLNGEKDHRWAIFPLRGRLRLSLGFGALSD